MLERLTAWYVLSAIIALVWSLSWSAGMLTGEVLAQDRIADHCVAFKAALFYDGRAVECSPIASQGTTGG